MQTQENELVRLGETIATLRQNKNWSQSELAAASGLESPFISEVEAGRAESTVLDIAALSKAFGITMKQLLEKAEL